MKPVRASARVWPVVLAACCLTVTLGSIHAFSVFTAALEERLAASRTGVSLIYSLALLSLTAAVYLGHQLYRRVPPVPLAATVCACAAAGL